LLFAVDLNMIDAVSEKKFLLLKKRLDALHYVQPFSADSASLVERLLNDLIKTTEGFQTLRKTNDELNVSVSKAEQRLEPLKKEIRLVLKENNELHGEIMRVKEDLEFKETKWNNTFRSLQDDKTDLKHVIHLKDVNVSKLQEEIFTLRKKLQILIKKHYLGPGKGLDNVPPEYRNFVAEGGKSAKFDLSKPLNDESPEAEDFKNWQDNSKRADDKVNNLKDELKESVNIQAELAEKIRHMENQLNNRDREIKRLQARIDVGDLSLEKISTEYALKTNSENINKLNSQIDYLTKENTSLETTLKGLKTELSRTEHLRTLNSRLEESVKNLTQKQEELTQTIKNKDRVLEKSHNTKKEAEKELKDRHNSRMKTLEKEKLELSKKFETLVLENSQFKLDATLAGQTLAAYNSDKFAFNEVIQELKQSRADLEARLRDYEDQLEQKSLENQRILEDFNVAQGKVNSLQREVDLLKIGMDKTTEEHSHAHQVAGNLRSRITELESENLNLNSLCKDLESEVERANKLRQHVEDQLERLRSDAYQTKANVDSSNVAKQRFETLYEGAQKDLEFQKQDNRNLQEKYLEEKRANNDLDLKCREYSGKLLAAEDRIKTLEIEVDMLNQQLSLRLQDIRRVEADNLNLERELSTLKLSYTRLEDQNYRDQQLRHDLKALEEDKAKTTRRIDELKFEIQDLTEKTLRQEEIIRKERLAKDELTARIEQLASESETIGHNLHKAREREHEYNNLLADLEARKRKETELSEEIERLQRDKRKQENLTITGTRQVDHLKQDRDELLHENKTLRDQVNNLRADEDDLKHRSIRLQEKIHNLEVKVTDLEDEKRRSDRKQAELEDETRRARNDLERERRDNTELNQKLHQFKTLSESLENTRTELLSKLQNKNSERGVDEADKNRLQIRLNTVTEDFKALQRERDELKNATLDIDRERDALQAQLDEKTEAFERLKRRYDGLDEEIRSLKERNLQSNASGDAYISKLQEYENTIRDLNRRIHTLVDENTHLKHKNALNETELANLRNDLNGLSRENRALNQKLTSLSEEQGKVQDVLSTTTTQERMMKQNLRATEMERDDIVTNYKAVCTENERLKRNNQELTAENQDQFTKIKDLQRDAAYLRGQIQQLEERQDQYLNELSADERKVEQLQRQLQQAESRVRDAQESKEKLIRSLNQSREITDDFGHSRDDLSRRLARSEQENAVLTDKVRELVSERDYLRQQLKEGNDKVRRFEEIINEEKDKQYKQSINIQNLENENHELQMNLDNYERRVQALQNNLSRETELHALNNSRDDSNIDYLTMRSHSILEGKLQEKSVEVSNLINEQRSLREENSKLRLNLSRAENQKEEYERKLKMTASFESSLSYGDRLFSDALSSKERTEREWERPEYRTGGYRRNFDQSSLSSQYLKEKGKTLKGEYGGY